MLLLVGCGTFTGCSDDDPEPPVNNGNNDDPQVAVSDEIFYANCFGKDVLSQYYYWCDEIAADLRQWDEETNEDPIGTVDRIKYHEGDKYIDKWTMMTDDVASFNSSMEGVSTTYGWNLTVYQISSDDNLCFGVVNFVYAGSPAEKAGLTSAEEAAFFPLYFELQDRKQQLNEEAWTLLREGKKDNVSEERYEEILNGVYEARISADRLEKIYFGKFKDILSCKKIYLVQQAEMHFHRELLKGMRGKGAPRRNVEK